MRGFTLKVIESDVRVMRKIHVTWRAVAQRGESGEAAVPGPRPKGGTKIPFQEKLTDFLRKLRKNVKI